LGEALELESATLRREVESIDVNLGPSTIQAKPEGREPRSD
jgi:hypothetical protein